MNISVDQICIGLIILSIILIAYKLYMSDTFLSSHYPHPEYFLTGRRMYTPQLPDFTSKEIK